MIGRRQNGPDPDRRVHDRPIRWRLVAPLILLGPLGMALEWAATRFPRVSDVYAEGVFPWLQRLLGLLTGWVPFSVAEAVVLLAALWLTAMVWRNVRRVRRGGRSLSNLLAHGGVNLLALAAALYGGEVLLWGLNYQRTPLAQRAGYHTSAPEVGELRALCVELIERTNAARREVLEDDVGVMRLAEGRRHTLGRAWLGYQRLAQLYEPLGDGYFGRVKGFALLSTPMSYLGGSGVFVPYSGEPTINIRQPDPAVPFTACHELAHQLGYAREEEANFLGYLACTQHPDADFRYSGYFEALRYAMNALYRADPQAFGELAQRQGAGVRRDGQALRGFWQRYRTPVAKAAERTYDRYLKSRGQEAGTTSYGLMVDLLIAHRRGT